MLAPSPGFLSAKERPTAFPAGRRTAAQKLQTAVPLVREDCPDSAAIQAFEQRRGQYVEHLYADLRRNRACPVAAAPPRVGSARLTIVVADDAGALSRLHHRAGSA